ncbi:Tafazzin -like protein [Trichinella pseudospiralis]|uniref:Tafazzin family protein n=1 Tax=Trichinella pseudospiralis TaxID=6337 RepID=A0A0V1FHS7_TRIPS|nr:Tafazzin -like protein [Trichinella pseudospiralis]
MHSKLARSIVICAVGCVSKLTLTWLNSCKVYNKDVFFNCLSSGKPLITVSNHHCCLDEPIMWGIFPWSFYFCNPLKMRWILAAEEIVFTNPIYSRFFSLGQCIPVVRGNGVYQTAVDRCIDVLNNCGWIHIFPQGRVNSSKMPVRLKWGVGRLINEAKILPTVLPLWIEGMENILPSNSSIPRILNRVLIYFGSPINNELFVTVRSSADSTMVKRLHTTNIVQQELYALQSAAEKFYKKQT